MNRERKKEKTNQSGQYQTYITKIIDPALLIPVKYQRRVQNPVKYLGGKFLRK